MAVVSDTLFIGADDGEAGYELWKSDGTPTGTLRVKDIHSGTEGSDPDGLTAHGGTLFFTASDGENGHELWQSDGTPEGTLMVGDIYPGANSSHPSEMTVFGDRLFFRASDGSTGNELWALNTRQYLVYLPSVLR
jgi:ELWxxDGT repeat protein